MTWITKKTGLALLSLTLVASALSQTKQRLSNPVTTGAMLQMQVTHCFLTGPAEHAIIHLEGVLDGKNLELSAEGNSLFNTRLLPPGSYFAVPAGGEDNKDGTVARQYYIVFPNGEHKLFVMTGISR